MTPATLADHETAAVDLARDYALEETVYRCGPEASGLEAWRCHLAHLEEGLVVELVELAQLPTAGSV